MARSQIVQWHIECRCCDSSLTTHLATDITTWLAAHAHTQQPCPYCYRASDPYEVPAGGWGPVCDTCRRGLAAMGGHP